jgi:hypothetical protein
MMSINFSWMYHIISNRLVDVYIDMTDAKVIWDALTVRCDAGNKLYLMESLHDYRPL